MFFNRIKTKSSQRFLTTVLNSRNKEFNSDKIQSVGIIFDYNNFQDYDFFKLMFTDLGLNTVSYTHLTLPTTSKV